MNSVSEKLEYFDLSYSNEPASYYYLIIELDAHQVKLMWYHLSKNLVTGFAHYPLPQGGIKEWLNSNPQITTDYKEVIVCMRTDNYLLNPKGILNGTDPEIFGLTNKLDSDNESLREFDLVNLKASCAFPISNETDESLHNAFSHLQIIPHNVPLLEQTLNAVEKRQSKTIVKAHINQESVDIIVVKEGQLLLCNSYFQTNKEDIAYYILFASETFDLNVEGDLLELSGEIEIADPTWQLLSDYWKRIELAKPLENIQVSTALDGYDKAQFDYLTYALLCAS